ncbi:uncharacterized protein ARMOST_02193 [Armillaria ostoyae]|uniref:Uncharacterized protein n=1 Tax=Armillaria ostoyae TaxID=47428 RepID=A0A284QR35_ARMOS|nr:uncharacterized protein ARMOST_02193 [Armillaria ostoyae]
MLLAVSASRHKDYLLAESALVRPSLFFCCVSYACSTKVITRGRQAYNVRIRWKRTSKIFTSSKTIPSIILDTIPIWPLASPMEVRLQEKILYNKQWRCLDCCEAGP